MCIHLGHCHHQLPRGSRLRSQPSKLGQTAGQTFVSVQKETQVFARSNPYTMPTLDVQLNTHSILCGAVCSLKVKGVPSPYKTSKLTLVGRKTAWYAQLPSPTWRLTLQGMQTVSWGVTCAPRKSLGGHQPYSDPDLYREASRGENDSHALSKVTAGLEALRWGCVAVTN